MVTDILERVEGVVDFSRLFVSSLRSVGFTKFTIFLFLSPMIFICGVEKKEGDGRGNECAKLRFRERAKKI